MKTTIPTEFENGPGLRAASRLFIFSLCHSVYEWVEIPVTQQLLDRIVHLYKLMKDNCLVSAEIEIATTWKLRNGWCNPGYPTTLMLLDDTALVQTLLEPIVPPSKFGPDIVKRIEALVQPFCVATEVIGCLQPLLQAQCDYIELPQCFGYTVNGIYELTAEERQFLLDSGCIDDIDAKVAEPALETWYPLQQEYFEKILKADLAERGQVPLRY